MGIKRTPLDIPLLLFLASAALSTLFAENRNMAWLGTYTRYDGLLTLITYAALFWLSVQSIADGAEARALMRVVLASGYVVSVIAIAQSLHDSLLQGSVAPAFGTLGNANVLGAFLALVIALGVAEMLVARRAAQRILLGNVLVVSIAASMLSLSRSSWLGTLAGIAFVIWLRPTPGLLRVAVPVVGAAGVLLAIGYFVSVPGQLERTLVDRALSIADPRQIAHARLGIWGDSLRMIASRPLTGYGPDNVGLVFPRFQTGDWGFTYSFAQGNVRESIDKTHAELLQVAATQGLIGVATYLLLQGTFLFVLWRARRIDQAMIAGAGFIAYTVVVQLNFTALAAAFPFWIFAAAATWSCDVVRTQVLAQGPGRARLALIPGVVLTAAAAWLGVAVPFAADAVLRQAVDAGSTGDDSRAAQLASEAMQLAPWESVYAVEVGNVALARGQWGAARAAYADAAALGTYNPAVYRNWALADIHLGRGDEARRAAEMAVELDRYDPANQALLAQFRATLP